MNKLEKSINIIFLKCLSVKKKEKVLIIFDENKKKIAEKFFEIGRKYADSIAMMQIPVGKISGEEPPKSAARELMDCNVGILITAKSFSHTKARKKASEKGVRIVTLPNVLGESLIRAIDVDYTSMNILNKKIKKLMDNGAAITITTKKGTMISASIKKRKAHGEDCGIFHKKGAFGNLPDGETFIAPIEGTANGVYVVDASMAGIGKLKNPIKFQVKNGFAVKIEGKKEAEKLKKLLKNYGKLGRNIAEIGIGTNPKAKIIGNVLEDEKVKGTAHIAIGNNFGFGGKVKVPLHLDGVFRNPTIFIDKKKIMENGKFII